MLPTTREGTPLCFLKEWRDHPHSWVKLWKHHAAQPEANRLTETARQMGLDFLDRYGGKVSSEWFFPKAWQILDEDPEVYTAADRLIEAADWIVWQLTGVETRDNTAAGLLRADTTGTVIGYWETTDKTFILGVGAFDIGSKARKESYVVDARVRF